MILIGEKINTTRKNIARAVEEKDVKFIKEEAIKQIKAGANFLEVNCGTNPEEEVENLCWLVKNVQEESDVPLCIDSANSLAVKEALKIHKGRAFINSITLEKNRYQNILPLVKEHNSYLVALTMDENGIENDSEKRFIIAKKLVDLFNENNLNLDSLYIDPLVCPVSTHSNQAILTLETMDKIKKWNKNIKIILGLSNISFGLPKRSLLNRVFLTLAMNIGLDAVILDCLDRELMATIFASNVLLNKDEYCLNYITAFREGKL